MLCRAAATHNEACVRLLLARRVDGNTRDQHALEGFSSLDPSEFPLIKMLHNLCMR